MKHIQNFDEQNFVGFIEETLREKGQKNLTKNHQPFIKLFHCQILCYTVESIILQLAMPINGYYMNDKMMGTGGHRQQKTHTYFGRESIHRVVTGGQTDGQGISSQVYNYSREPATFSQDILGKMGLIQNWKQVNRGP